MEKQISWSAPEFIHYPKSKAWFIIMTALGAALIVYFLSQKDFLTAVLFFCLLGLMFYFARAKPKTVRIELDSYGIKVGELKLPYSQIKSFWIVYEPPEVKTLNFETTAYLNRNLTLQLGSEDPVKIRKFLLEYLPEDLDKEEGVADKLARKLKF